MFVRLVLLVTSALTLWAFVARDTSAEPPTQTYRVQAGDTLWSIAVAHHAGDPREGVWELQERNRLRSTTIQPGQLLVLP